MTAARLALVLALFTFPFLTACGAECDDGEQQCVGEQIQTCVDGAWGDPVECEGMMSCMQMDDGVQHCMDMGMSSLETEPAPKG